MCKFCEEGKSLIKEKEFMSNVQKNDGSFCIYVGYTGYRESDYTRIKINYCPMCGRKLEELIK